MRGLLVGSRAMAHWLNINRQPLDWDLIVHPDQLKKTIADIPDKASWVPISEYKWVVRTKNGAIYEIIVAWEDTTDRWLLNYVNNSWSTAAPFSSWLIPRPDILYVLKMSHRYLKNSPHFKKTMNDIHFLRSKGFGTIQPELQDFYKARMKETYNYSHPKLAQGKDTFFSNDGVKYVYDHDSIHLAMAIDGVPAYKHYQKKGSEVLTDRELWNKASIDIKLRGVYEEVCVLAIERGWVPGQMGRKTAYMTALEKVCTSITSGYFREFAWEHYQMIVDMYDPSYVEDFEEAVAAGIVKPYKVIEHA